jgi:hypothetical protein
MLVPRNVAEVWVSLWNVTGFCAYWYNIPSICKLLAFRGKSAEEPTWLDIHTTGLAIKQIACSLRRHWEGGVQAYPSTNPEALWPWRHWFMRPPPSLCRSPISLSSGSRKMRAEKQKTGGWTPSTWDERLSPLLTLLDRSTLKQCLDPVTTFCILGQCDLPSLKFTHRTRNRTWKSC